MLMAMVLICSMATAPDLARYSTGNAESVFRVPQNYNSPDRVRLLRRCSPGAAGRARRHHVDAVHDGDGLRPRDLYAGGIVTELRQETIGRL